MEIIVVMNAIGLSSNGFERKDFNSDPIIRLPGATLALELVEEDQPTAMIINLSWFCREKTLSELLLLNAYQR